VIPINILYGFEEHARYINEDIIFSLLIVFIKLFYCAEYTLEDYYNVAVETFQIVVTHVSKSRVIMLLEIMSENVELLPTSDSYWFGSSLYAIFNIMLRNPDRSDYERIKSTLLKIIEFITFHGCEDEFYIEPFNSLLDNCIPLLPESCVIDLVKPILKEFEIQCKDDLAEESSYSNTLQVLTKHYQVRMQE